MIYSIKFKPLLISIAIALGAGFIGGLLGDSRGGFETLVKPSFAPPAVVFPVVWTILYTLMGIAAYLVFVSKDEGRTRALQFYALQLAVNVLWTFFFFGLGQYLFAFWWVILLIILVTITIIQFYRINPNAAYLMVPYLLWLIFAAYLNYSIYTLNMR